MSLIETFDKLTSGKLVQRIVCADSEINAPAGVGMNVAFAEDNVDADAWLCHDKSGIWLTTNAHQSSASGYHGFGGVEEPLSKIKAVILLDVAPV